eukprot:scaffold250849_cov27-Tisochrysis_lutea.AAC.2
MQGLNPNVMAGSGGAPLMIAARLGAADAVDVLLAAGANPDTRAEPSAAFVEEVRPWWPDLCAFRPPSASLRPHTQ